MKAKKLYNMELDDVLEQYADFGRLVIRRVPGGWLYTHYAEQDAQGNPYLQMTSTFIPFDNEFQEDNPPEQVFTCSEPGCSNKLLHRVEIMNETCDDCLYKK